MTLQSNKIHANKGIERNKKPLQNICYRVEFRDPQQYDGLVDDIAPYLFKDKGCIVLRWGYQKQIISENKWRFGGLTTPDKLRGLIGEKQWAKFCQGKTEFIVQRRIDGKNIKK